MRGKKKTHEQFIEETKIKHPNIEVLGEYTKNYRKIKCKCLLDGHIWDTRPSALYSGSGCPKCWINRETKRRTKSHEQFIKELKLINPNIEILGEYINSNTKIKCKCLIDDYTWEVKPSALVNLGQGCPKCSSISSSKGETVIEKYCKNNYLQYKSQYKIDKCKYKRQLPFDFALFNKNKLVTLIEYQGEQHYRPVDFAGKGEEWAKERFYLQQKKDQTKRDYCLYNDIPLIEIPYWIDDVENYLDEQLDKIINKPMQLSLV